MELFRGTMDSIGSFPARRITTQFINLGLVMAWALMIWKLWIYVSGSDSPIVVVLSGSMEPGFKRGDVLFLHMEQSPIQSEEIVVFNIEGKDIPVVHRVITVHQHRDTHDINVLTKGDNNPEDDRHGIYADNQLWLEKNHIIGRVMGYFPYAGWATILMTEKPVIKYLLIGALSLLVIKSKE